MNIITIISNILIFTININKAVYWTCRFFDDGGTIADIQSFNTQVGPDGIPISASGGGRGFFKRNRPSKRSLPGRSSSQGSALQSVTIPSSNLANNNPTLQQSIVPQQGMLTQSSQTFNANLDSNTVLPDEGKNLPWIIIAVIQWIYMYWKSHHSNIVYFLLF